MIKRIDHIGVIVDDLEEASRLLTGIGMRYDRDLELPGRLKASFFSCGNVQIEAIEISEPAERARRLGSEAARIEHVAFEVDDLAATMDAMAALGVKTQTADPLRIGESLNHWTVPETCDGIVYQLIEGKLKQ